MPTLNPMQRLLKLVEGSADKQISVIQKGVPRVEFTDMAKVIGLSEKGLAESLKISDRTLRNRTAHERMSRIETEKFLRVVRVYDKALRVLGNGEKAKHWIDSPIKSLGNRRPIDFLETDVGTNEVINVLNAIEWGVYL